jgi:transcriptional regulator with XRE-family HTH domain
MNNELGIWIEKECKKRGWSQRKLAYEAGISQAPISRIINKIPTHQNEQLCGQKVAQALAKAFGVNQIYVFRLAHIFEPIPQGRNFSSWLINELFLRRMSKEDLAEQSGIDIKVINDLTNEMPPNFEVAEKLARVLDLDLLYVQQLTGLLPPCEQALTEEELELVHGYRELSKTGRQVLQDIVKSLKQNLRLEKLTR